MGIIFRRSKRVSAAVMRTLLSGQTLCRIRNLYSTIQVVSARNLGIMASKVVRMEKRDETHGSAGAETSRKSNHQRVEELQQLVRNDSTGTSYVPPKASFNFFIGDLFSVSFFFKGVFGQRGSNFRAKVVTFFCWV